MRILPFRFTPCIPRYLPLCNIRTMSSNPDKSESQRNVRRPSIVGPSSGPASPFPIYMSGPVVHGFGRGSRELGIPTANLERENASLQKFLQLAEETSQAGKEEHGEEDGSGKAKGTGIYFGFARIIPESLTFQTHQYPSEMNNGVSNADRILSSIAPSKEQISALPQHTASYPISPSPSPAPSSASSSHSAGGQAVREDGQNVSTSLQTQRTIRKKRQWTEDDAKVWPMVMSVGLNPFYGNKELTAVSLVSSALVLIHLRLLDFVAYHFFSKKV